VSVPWLYMHSCCPACHVGPSVVRRTDLTSLDNSALVHVSPSFSQDVAKPMEHAPTLYDRTTTIGYIIASSIINQEASFDRQTSCCYLYRLLPVIAPCCWQQHKKRHSHLVSLESKLAFSRPELEPESMEGAKQRQLNNVILINLHSLPKELLPSILSHLDVKTLIQKKKVCRSCWGDTCKKAIAAKQTSTMRKAFLANPELCQAVKKYCGYNKATNSYSQCDPQDTEEFAQTYGYTPSTSGMFPLCKTCHLSLPMCHLMRTFCRMLQQWKQCFSMPVPLTKICHLGMCKM
jgi:hypothetical protein